MSHHIDCLLNKEIRLLTVHLGLANECFQNGSDLVPEFGRFQDVGGVQIFSDCFGLNPENFGEDAGFLVAKSLFAICQKRLDFGFPAVGLLSQPLCPFIFKPMG